MTTPDARPHFDALKAAIKAQFGTVEVYDYGTVPGSDNNAGTLPPRFALLGLERRSNTNLRLTAQSSTTGWRATVRVVCMTPAECRAYAFKVTTALNEQRLIVAGVPTTPIQFEPDSGEQPQKAETRYEASSMYVYAH